MMDMAGFRFWAEMVDRVATAALFVWVYFSNRHRVTVGKIEKIERDTHKRLDDHGTRMTCLESDVKHSPSRAEINSLEDKIEKMNALLSRVDGRLEGINRAVDLMNNYLINKDKGKS